MQLNPVFSVVEFKVCFNVGTEEMSQMLANLYLQSEVTMCCNVQLKYKLDLDLHIYSHNVLY